MSSRDAGIIVVDRLEFFHWAQEANTFARRNPALTLSDEQVFRAYRGFDALVWPGVDCPVFAADGGLAAISDLPLVEGYRTRLPKTGGYDLIMLARPGCAPEHLQNQHWRFAGYDLGYFEDKWSHFSVLLNEIVYGSLVEMRAFVSSLNENLLLENPAEATSIIDRRDDLLQSGADLEICPEVAAIEIFVPV